MGYAIDFRRIYFDESNVAKICHSNMIYMISYNWNDLLTEYFDINTNVEGRLGRDVAPSIIKAIDRLKSEEGVVEEVVDETNPHWWYGVFDNGNTIDYLDDNIRKGILIKILNSLLSYANTFSDCYLLCDTHKNEHMLYDNNVYMGTVSFCEISEEC